MKNTWAGTRSIISLQKMTYDSPKIIREQWQILLIISSGRQRQKLCQRCHFHTNLFFQYLSPPNRDLFFISPYTKKEIIKIISNFRSTISAGPNTIPTKFLRLLADDICEHRSIIFNIHFANGIFPEKLKVAKVIPVHKKDSKLVCSNHRSISLLSNIDEILEKIMHN